jgi:tetratricopeptide (TPR) repeat protein
MTIGDWETAQLINARVISNPDLPASLQVFAQINEGMIWSKTGDIVSAERVLPQALGVVGQTVAQAQALQEKGETETAFARWQEVTRLYLAMGNTIDAASALEEMAEILGDVGQFDDAWQILGQALSLAVEGGSQTAEFQVLREMGGLALIKRQPKDAEIICHRMLDLLEQMSLGANETGARRAYVMRLLAGSALQRDKLDEALTWAQEALRLQQQFLPEPDSLASAWQVLAKVHKARGEVDEAAKAYQESGQTSCSQTSRDV